MHRHGVKRESDIKIKWRFKSFRFVELSQNTIIKDFGRILVNFGVFWHLFFYRNWSKRTEYFTKAALNYVL